MPEYIKDKINLDPSAMRKIQFVISNKNRIKLFNEVSYYKNIYSAVDEKTLLNAVINKYVNMKIHKLIYFNIDKDLENHRKKIIDTFKFYDDIY